MNDKLPILYFWADPVEAERLIRELAETGVNFEAKLVRTLEEYVSALVKAEFALIIADERAETAGTGSEDLSLFQIAEQISPGTPFVLLRDTAEKSIETAVEAVNFTSVPRQDLHRLQSVIDRALNNFDGG
jgi:hypothetical protein